MTGEVPYTRLPFYLHGFDVCILPFRVIPLTLATNPVKVYEYLSAGKPVVSVDLPEIAQFGDLVAKAARHDEFLALVEAALRDGADAEAIAARRRFGSEQTWAHRVSDLRAALSEVRRPRASIVVVTYNNLVFTQACLSSLESNTEYPEFEVIVVDNGSTDGTPDFLRRWAEGAPNRSAILNDDNKGFAAANNQGLRVATGEFLVLLNNDTFVTPGWLGSLIRHLERDSDLGLVGPVTNNIGNEARIDIHYSDMEEMRRRALAYTSRHLGALYKVPTVAFFCVAMTRSTYEVIGDLDEAFAVGFFEDDDYCRRVGLAGKSVAIAEDVFIHHHLSASFDALAAERRREIFEQNRRVYEAKWGQWTMHEYRPPARDRG
jgi:GT2 family glycosyltransferase